MQATRVLLIYKTGYYLLNHEVMRNIVKWDFFPQLFIEERKLEDLSFSI